jgi:hypothetical protein
VGDWRVLYRVLVGKTEGNVPHGRPKHRRKIIIKMDFQEVRCSGMPLIEMIHNKDSWRALVNV